MTSDIISKRTRNAFREYLVGCTLAEIGAHFEEAGIEPDRGYTPDVGGERRALVPQH